MKLLNALFTFISLACYRNIDRSRNSFSDFKYIITQSWTEIENGFHTSILEILNTSFQYHLIFDNKTFKPSRYFELIQIQINKCLHLFVIDFSERHPKLQWTKFNKQYFFSKMTAISIESIQWTQENFDFC